MKVIAFEDIQQQRRAEREAAAARPEHREQNSGARDHGEPSGEGGRAFSEIAPDGLRFHLGRGVHHDGKAPFRAPRHHHAFQQVRWNMAGRKNYAPDQYLEAGDVGYFPKGAYYGPEVKEGFYDGWATQFGFGDQHQLGADWEPFRREARKNLMAHGVMENGRYTPSIP